ncbi:redoxin domain-containing protein [Saccharicrinis sp. FJH54]|uniref:redoxin domain-containing protein n=1 Tax=Saccharicrinis sp. FJH54 TaxID=3344665 RepID=UPI0035D45713
MKKTLYVLIVILIAVSCNKKPKGLVIDGRITNAGNEYVYLSTLGAQNMELIDSLKLKNNGKFKFTLAPPEYPEFYFLRFGKKETVTILADSAEHISVNSEFPDVLERAEISGSNDTKKILEMDRKLRALRVGYKNYRKAWDETKDPAEKEQIVNNIIDEINAYKKEAGQMVMENPRSFFGYYILYQRLDNTYALFNPYDKNDFKYFGALATSLNIYYPDAPRTKALYAKVEDAIRVQRQERFDKMLQEAEQGLPDIEMPDVNGDTVKLSSLKGKTIILNYWASTNQTSRVNNRILKTIYNKYKNKGLEIYQCSLDKSKVLWEVALDEDNINWISLCDFKGADSRAVWMYNVQEVPTTYLINKKGDIVGKYNDPIELEKKINEILR